MSEFTNNNEIKLKKLLALAEVIINKQKPAEYVKANMDTIDAIMPSDVITLVHRLVEKDYPIDELKKHIAKLLNLFYKALLNFSNPEPEPNSLLDILIQNNRVMQEKLNLLKNPIKALNSKGKSDKLILEIADKIEGLKPYTNYFTIKENLLFPYIEENWADFKCVKVMWSIHDDIRLYLKQLTEMLEGDKFELKTFNIISTKLFFDVKAIIFRDEAILFPQILKTFSNKKLYKLLEESIEFDFPFIKPTIESLRKEEDYFWENGEVNLGTGSLSPKEISLIFNHLPIDITFVDDKNRVKYFSTPGHRIFPRTTAIIGRKVENCHPPESVHIVERIVNAFRKGENNEASFWIPMGKKFVLIKYFAVRDNNGNFKGTLEVSQEISDIKALEGEKRLLDWD